MAAMPFEPLPDARRDELVGEVRAAYRWGEAGYASILAGLDGEHGYLRFCGSPSEESRAIQPMGVLFGMHLAKLGWRWARASDGAVAVASADARFACRLVEVVCALLDRDDTNFSWLLQQLQTGGPPAVKGVVALAP